MTPETALAELRADAQRRFGRDAEDYLAQVAQWLMYLRLLVDLDRTPGGPHDHDDPPPRNQDNPNRVERYTTQPAPARVRRRVLRARPARLRSRLPGVIVGMSGRQPDNPR